jgi:hypothetical protein
MTTSINPISLADKKPRVAQINGEQIISILDVLKLVGTPPNGKVPSKATVSAAWSRLQDKHPAMKASCINHQFSGPGARGTPAGNKSLILDIILMLPGEAAETFRKSAIYALLKTLDPDEDFVDEISTRMQLVRDGELCESLFDAVLIDTPEKRVLMSTRAFKETNIYVRVRLPSQYCVEQHTKTLTLDVIKFGITFDKNGRHLQYGNDDGFMAYAFMCKTRQHAHLVEEHLRTIYRTITMYDSHEYINTAMLAADLEVEYERGSYDSYIGVAQALFVRIVEILQFLHPRLYCGKYGSATSTVETRANKSSRVLMNPISHDQMDVDLEYDCEQITPAVAREMGFKVPEVSAPVPTTASSNTIIPLSHTALSNATRVVEAVPALTEVVPCHVVERINGPVISRDLVTGEEVLYDNIIKAAKEADIGRQSLNRTYLNKARQLLGRHWRTPGAQYWAVTEEFIYDPSYVETAAAAYIKAVDSMGKIKVYESRNAARHILGLTASQIQELTKAMRDGVQFMGSMWSNVPGGEASLYGTWHDDDGDHTEALRT